ncbi:MAG: hypothetical protein H7A55_16690 [Verrucomicrobiaceae bacterium]|nr:hypothetical protein [Verrucomicrobiaceae bacterium]
MKSFILAQIAWVISLIPGGPLKAEDDLYAWSVRSYRAPESMFWAAAGEGLNPEMPRKEASASATVEILRQNHGRVAQALAEEGIHLPEGSLAVMDGDQATLVVRTMGHCHGLLRAWERTLWPHTPRNLAFRLDVVEVDAAFMQQVMRDAGDLAEHGPLLARFDEPGGAGLCQFVTSTRLEGKSGQEIRLTVAGEAAGDPPHLKLQIDAALGRDDESIDVKTALDLYGFTGQAEGREGWQTFSTVCCQLRNGQTRLINVWPVPEGPLGRVRAAFLNGRILPVLPQSDGRAEALVNQFGASVIPLPKPGTAAVGAAQIPEGMALRRFRVSPDFCQVAMPAGDRSSDPFGPTLAASEKKFGVPQEILAAQGITFPEGAFALLAPMSRLLVVQNTPENLDLVDAYLEWGDTNSPRDIALILHVIEGDAKTLRDMERQSPAGADQGKLLESLLNAAANGSGGVVQSSWAMTQSGARVAFGSGEVKKPHRLDESWNLGNFASGLSWEIDPILGADGRNLDLNLAVNTFGQAMRVSQSTLKTSLTVLSGMKRFLGLWKPEGVGQDRLQAVFLEARIVRFAEDQK